MINRSTALTLSMGILALGLLSPAVAETTSKEVATTETTATGKPPVTPADHMALADSYRKQTAAYRQEATTHREMLETYKKKVSVPTDARRGSENPWIAKMRVHCEAYIRDAENLATGAEKFADFHTMRAAELQGK